MTIELDPNGKATNDPGAKLDQDKILPHLMMKGFAKALKEIALVTTLGSKKYSPGGWKIVPEGIERYTEAMQRHYLDEADGILYDPDLTKRADKPIHHAACIAWNSLARLELILQAEQLETQNVIEIPKNENST